MIKITELFNDTTGVRAFATHAGFNICTYAGAADYVEADLRELEEITGIGRKRIYLPVQTHSAEIRVVAPGVDLQGVDGVVCTEPGVLIGVHTADCLPLLMVDTEAGVAAAVHCGWRGTVAGIAVKAVDVMCQCGARPERIKAVMGPCICPECFEVGEEVAGQFPAEAVIRAASGAPEKPHVDLARAVELQLQQVGVRDVTRPPACSKHSGDFYSVRRQGRALSLRTLSALALTE